MNENQKTSGNLYGALERYDYNCTVSEQDGQVLKRPLIDTQVDISDLGKF